ncbi:MAG: hypothetical protein ABIK28_08825 [Planctomycetota bacterium]
MLHDRKETLIGVTQLFKKLNKYLHLKLIKEVQMKTKSFQALSTAFLVGILFILCSSIPALADTVYDNYGPGSGGFEYDCNTAWFLAGQGSGFNYVEQAHVFTSSKSGNLSDIYLGLGKVLSFNKCTIKLAPDKGGPPSDNDVLETWVLNDLPPIYLGEVTQLVSVEQPYLTAGQSYWIWISVDSGSSAAWGQNVTNVKGHIMEYIYDFNMGYIWTDLGSDWYNAAMRIDVREPSLTVDENQIPEQTGGTINFELTAGIDYANRPYILLGGISGIEPGTPLPGGNTTLPINWDVFTDDLLLPLINTSIFQNFMGTLDTHGLSTAQLNAPPLPGFAGLQMYFAYCLSWPWEFASNSVEIDIVP